jgi:hypothetical protein
MSRPRDDFSRWTDCLLDAERSPGDQRQAAHEWCAWGLQLLGVDESDVNQPEAFYADTILDGGKAISPLGAARCIREYRRTAVFLQGMDAAIETALQQFPDEPLHVLEAGCGPLAPLALPFALRYPPERVTFTLLDLHPASLESARRVVAALGLERSIREYVAADAIRITLPPEKRPHVIACEVLLRALTREPQVAVTFNLAPQLRAGGVFVPERIDVDAALFDASRVGAGPESPAGPVVAELGNVYSLHPAGIASRTAVDRLPANSIAVPPHDPRRTPLKLLTRIQVFGDHWLGDMESSLNTPLPIGYPNEIAELGGELDFVYDASNDPRLRIVRASAANGV